MSAPTRIRPGQGVLRYGLTHCWFCAVLAGRAGSGAREGSCSMPESPRARAEAARYRRDAAGEVDARLGGHGALTSVRWYPARVGDRLVVTCEATDRDCRGPTRTRCWTAPAAGCCAWSAVPPRTPRWPEGSLAPARPVRRRPVRRALGGGRSGPSRCPVWRSTRSSGPSRPGLSGFRGGQVLAPAGRERHSNRAIFEAGVAPGRRLAGGAATKPVITAESLDQLTVDCDIFLARHVETFLRAA